MFCYFLVIPFYTEKTIDEFSLFFLKKKFQSNFAAAVQQSTPPLSSPLTTPAFLNAQTKPKVSSPAPSKIYGRPGSLSTDPIKSDLGLKNVNQSQDHHMLTEPPPAHSHHHHHHHHRNQQQKYLLPQSSAVTPFDLAGVTAAAGGAVIPIPLSHSPGIHAPSPIPAPALILSAPMVTTANTNSTLIDFQSKPLDLGISERHRNSTVNRNSPITRTISTPPSPAKHPIGLNITKAAVASARSMSPLGVKKSNDIGEITIHDLPQRLAAVQSSIAKEPNIKVPIITVTAADTIGSGAAAATMPQHQLHIANSIIRSYEIDDTSNSSSNSKYENTGRFDADQLIMANGTINNTNSKIVPIAIAPVTTTTMTTTTAATVTAPKPPPNKGYKNNGNDNQQRVHQSTPTPPPPSATLPQKNPLRTNSADGLLRSSSTNSSPVPSPNSAQSAPATPVKFPNDYEKASSPGEFYALFSHSTENFKINDFIFLAMFLL